MEERETRLRVRYVETDQMGIAHHASYFAWFEVARTEHMRLGGLPYEELERLGIYLPVIEAWCEYKSPARYDDIIAIKTKVEPPKALRITFTYQVFNDSTQKLLAKGGTTHAPTNKSGKPVNLPKLDPDLWTRLLRSVGALV